MVLAWLVSVGFVSVVIFLNNSKGVSTVNGGVFAMVGLVNDVWPVKVYQSPDYRQSLIPRRI